MKSVLIQKSSIQLLTIDPFGVNYLAAPNPISFCKFRKLLDQHHIVYNDLPMHKEINVRKLFLLIFYIL